MLMEACKNTIGEYEGIGDLKKNWKCPDCKSTGTCDNIKSTGDLPSLSTSKKSQTSCVNIQMHACM